MAHSATIFPSAVLGAAGAQRAKSRKLPCCSNGDPMLCWAGPCLSLSAALPTVAFACSFWIALPLAGSDWMDHVQKGNIALAKEDFAGAAGIFSRALEFATQSGESAGVLAQVRCRLGTAMAGSGQLTTGVSEMVSSIQILRQSGPRLAVSTCAVALSGAHRDRGDFESARRLLEEAIGIEEGVPGRERWLAGTWTALGSLELRMGETKRAILHLERSLKIQEQHLPPQDRDLADTLRVLAMAYRALNRYQDAVRVAERASQINQSPGFRLRMFALLASSNADLRRFKASVEWCARLRAVLASTPDLPPQLKANSLMALAYVASARREFDEAEQLYAQTVKTMEQDPATHREDLATVWIHQGRLRLRTGKYRAAEECHRRALAILQDAAMEEHPFSAFALLDLADTYRLARRFVESIDAYRKGLALAERYFGRGSAELALDYRNFAEVLARKNAKREAQEYLRMAESAGHGTDSLRRGLTVDVEELRRKPTRK